MTLRWKEAAPSCAGVAMLAFARHEAIAEQDRHPLDADALGEIRVVIDEDVADVIRMRQHPQVAIERGEWTR